MRLTWVTDHLAHVLDEDVGDGSDTWTGLACPDHGLPIGSDGDTATLLRLVGQGEIADLTWEAPADFTTEYGQLCIAAIQTHQSGRVEEGERLWEQVIALWSQAWSANYQALEFMQKSGLTRFSPAKPQRWVIASFGLPHPPYPQHRHPSLDSIGQDKTIVSTTMAPFHMPVAAW